MIEQIQPITWVAHTSALQELCTHWRKQPTIAVDTEFMRTNTYYPIPALIQVSDGSANYLIDPKSISDFTAFADVMSDASVQKVLHSCSEDLEVFQRLLGRLPVNLFDTQVAAAFCGYGFSMGYANLVEAMLNVQLPKGETRSDWLQRPLTDAQRLYAALDVEHLHVIAQKLSERLQQLGRTGWVDEDCQALLDGYAQAQDPASAIYRFRSAWRLAPRNLAVLVALSSWREQTAQARDLPRNHVIKERSLYAIAEAAPAHLSELHNIEDLSERALRRYGEEVIDVVAQIMALDDAQLPVRMARPPSSTQNNRIKLMRETLASVAEKLDIAPEVLARKKDFEFIVRALEAGAVDEQIFPPSFSGWRAEIVKQPLGELL